MRNSLLGLAALPLGAGILSRQALAQDLPPLDPENPQAKALNYVTQASDASDHPVYADGEKCSNCMFYNADTQGCQLFPQNSVAADGWCQSWTTA
jgi:hypothetical protein